MSHTPCKLLLLLLPVLVAATFPLSCEECIRILVLDKKLDVEPDLDATQTQVSYNCHATEMFFLPNIIIIIINAIVIVGIVTRFTGMRGRLLESRLDGNGTRN